MARPIVWAVGILVSTVVSSIGAGDRLMHFVRANGRAPAASTPAGPAGPATVTLNADLRGHYTAHPSVNGQRLRMLVDTGASLVALSEEDAAMVGIRVQPRDFTLPISTANGIQRGAPVTIAEMRIGEIAVQRVEAVVMPRGLLGTSLLGMSFLRRLQGFEIASGRLTLKG